MIVIDDILVSDEVIDQKFLCNLNKCKGACCREGDFGAPVDQEEQEIIEKIYPLIEPLLTEESKNQIAKDGLFKKYKNDSFVGTNLLEDGSCVFLKENEIGILQCMIEKAYNKEIIDFKKPISCHLYPIRVSEKKEVNLTAVNYDEWDICSAACSEGKKQDLPLFQFVKEALIRKFGQSFYDQLEGAYQFKKLNDQSE